MIRVLILLFACIEITHYMRLNEQNTAIADINTRISSIQEEVENINAGNLSGQAPKTSADIDFLKEQIKAHQDFIERERDFLVWMLGVIFAVGGALIGFWGFKSRKEVESMINERYHNEIGDQIRNMLGKAVGGNKNLRFLESAVKKEKKAHSKKVCFIKQKNSKELDKIYNWLQDEYKNTVLSEESKEELSAPSLFSNLNEDRKYLDYDIYVYEVSSEEFGNDKEAYDNGNPLEYKILSDFCEKNNKQCILVCLMGSEEKAPRNQINIRLIDEIHGTTVQFISKLRETLSTLLYM